MASQNNNTMKKILLAIVAAVMTIGSVSAQQYMYIWKKDGTHVAVPVEKMDSLGFYAPTYTLAVTVEGAGTVTGQGQYKIDETATLTATPASGYTFTQWSDGITDNPREVTMVKDMTLTAVFTAKAGGTRRFMVMSDMHVLVNALQNTGHPEVFYSDHKMAEHSQELFDLAIARVIAAAPDFLLVPGDMTYNGELLSHQYVAQRFAKLEEAGIEVFVIPGNHDVSDPGAKDYSSGSGVKTNNLSAEQFAVLYNDYGYNDAVMRLDEGTDSLAYMAYFSQDIAVIGLNTNQSNIGGHKSAGGFTEGMISFLEQCTAKALAEGRTNILVMAHHPIMEHINGQSFIDVNHIANMEDGMIALSEIQERLTAAHVHAVFTGHAHIHSVAHINTSNGVLYDFSTGSLIAYPSPMRVCTLDADNGMLSVSGTEIENYLSEGYARDTVLSNAAVIKLAAALYSGVQMIKEQIAKYPQLNMFFNMNTLNQYDAAGMRAVVRQYMGNDLHKALCALARGDEDVYYYDNEAQTAVDHFDNMVQAVIGMNYATVVMALQMAGVNADFGIDPETLFNSIYINTVTSGENTYYTPDAAGEQGSIQENIPLRDVQN